MVKQTEYSPAEIARALFIVNRHAKTAPDPRQLYDMKKQTISKLLKEKKAEKIGLHFSDRPKYSHQHSTLLVQVSDYYFHIPPAKQDFKELEHLGNVDKDYRNPRPRMSLNQAKKVLNGFLGRSAGEEKREKQEKKAHSSYFTPSSLGQFQSPHRGPRKY